MPALPAHDSPMRGLVLPPPRYCLWFVCGLAVATRALLVAFSPREFGYVWDLYHEGIQVMFAQGRLPVAGDCWECWQPPLFFLVSYPFYALGRLVYPAPSFPYDRALWAVAVVPLAASFVTLDCVWRQLRLVGLRGYPLVFGLSVAACIPVVFYNSFALDIDTLLMAVVALFTYRLSLVVLVPSLRTNGQALLLGAVAGLAAITKYSGLVAAVAGVLVLLSLRLEWRRRFQMTMVFGLTVTALAGWLYARNVVERGRLLPANGPADAGFSLTHQWASPHQIAPFRIGELMTLTRPDAPPGMLTDLPVYKSILTSMHGLMWGDMGFFSNPTRHGTRYPFYPDREVPPWLAASVLALGLLPTTLAAVGAAARLRQRRYRALLCVTGIGLVAYLQWAWWMPIWGIKPKYLLFLLPAYAAWAATGGRVASGIPLPGWHAAIAGAIVALIVLANAYLVAFALGPL